MAEIKPLHLTEENKQDIIKQVCRLCEENTALQEELTVIQEKLEASDHKVKQLEKEKENLETKYSVETCNSNSTEQHTSEQLVECSLDLLQEDDNHNTNGTLTFI